MAGSLPLSTALSSAESPSFLRKLGIWWLGHFFCWAPRKKTKKTKTKQKCVFSNRTILLQAGPICVLDRVWNGNTKARLRPKMQLGHAIINAVRTSSASSYGQREKLGLTNTEIGRVHSSPQGSSGSVQMIYQSMDSNNIEIKCQMIHMIQVKYMTKSYFKHIHKHRNDTYIYIYTVA